MNFFLAIGAFFVALSSLISSFFPMGSMKISVEPAVFDCGNEYYAVVWATSRKGSGCVKYMFNGTEKTVWDESAGIIRTDDTVHSVLVPKAELQGNSYKVCSQYVGFKYGYSAATGKTVESPAYSFNDIPDNDGINILSISDIHEEESKMWKSLSYFEQKPDLVVMLGDITSTLETKQQFVNHLLKDAHDLSGGTVPVIYTRGNHETRGEFGAQMLNYFPFETGEFYFTFDFGPLSAIILDSGEDKEDDHPEYSGLVDFATYREQEFNWLTSLDKADFADADYKLVFSHNPVLNNYFGKDWVTPLVNLEMDMIIGGHYHKSEFVDGELPIFFDCGKSGSIWAASMMTLSNGTIRMLTIDNSGNTLLDKTVTL